MYTRTVLSLGVAAGFLLAIAGIVFPFWMIPTGLSLEAQAAHLDAHFWLHLVYVLALVLSSLLIAPVIVVLTVRLYRRGLSSGIVAATLLIFGLVLQVLATLGSLAQWASAVPAAMRGEVAGMQLFETLQYAYLIVDFAGVIAAYVAAAIYASLLSKMHQLSAILLAASVLIFIIAGATSVLTPSVSNILSGVAIILYGAAYIALAKLAAELAE